MSEWFHFGGDIDNNNLGEVRKGASQQIAHASQNLLSFNTSNFDPLYPFPTRVICIIVITIYTDCVDIISNKVDKIDRY